MIISGGGKINSYERKNQNCLEFFNEIKKEWCVSEEQYKPFWNDVITFARKYHKEQVEYSKKTYNVKKKPAITTFKDYVSECTKANEIWAVRRLFMPCYRDYKVELEQKHKQIHDNLKKMLNNGV